MNKVLKQQNSISSHIPPTVIGTFRDNKKTNIVLTTVQKRQHGCASEQSVAHLNKSPDPRYQSACFDASQIEYESTHKTISTELLVSMINDNSGYKISDECLEGLEITERDEETFISFNKAL